MSTQSKTAKLINHLTKFSPFRITRSGFFLTFTPMTPISYKEYQRQRRTRNWLWIIVAVCTFIVIYLYIENV